MARLIGPVKFTGKLQGISGFKREGDDGITIRPCYGPSKHDIDTKPSYANTKRENFEFGGRATAAKWIRNGYYPLDTISDPKNLGRLNAILKPIQEMDTEGAYGQRSVYLTRGGELLEGFQMNEKHPFESVLRTPVDCSISRSELKALVDLPAMIPGINFHPPASLPFFRVVATLSVVPDLYYNEIKYRPIDNYDSFRPEIVKTDWLAAGSDTEIISMAFEMPQAPPNDQFILLLSLGIEMGQAKTKLLIKAIKYAGCGKILAVG